jgi:hypothetical protein
MKKSKLIVLMLSAAMTISIAGCSEDTANPAARNAPIDENGYRDTPVRVAPNGTISQASGMMLDMAFEYIDIIADITIVEWLGEAQEGYATFFRAKVNKTLVGEEFEEIEIIQSGNSVATVENLPLFKNGDRILAFLEKTNTSPEEKNEYSEKYWVWETIFWDISAHENQTYLISRNYWSFADDFLKNNNVQKIEGELRSSINEGFRKHDPVLAEMRDFELEQAEANRDHAVEKFLEDEAKQLGKEYTPPNLIETYIYRDVFDYSAAVNAITKLAKENKGDE